MLALGVIRHYGLSINKCIDLQLIKYDSCLINDVFKVK